MKLKTFVWNTSLFAALLALAGCSVLEGDKIDYKSANRGTSLEVPPDLTRISADPRYNIPASTVSANALLSSQIQRGTNASVAANNVGDVQLHSDGATRWLSIPREPDVLWKPVRQFWMDNGFALTIDQPAIGVMETDWAENRAKLPQDFIRNTLGRVLDSLYSTGERDKFRTRIERNAQGGSDIYITHRGMVEEYTTKAQDNTTWVPRASDPELEAEFLRRLLVSLGVAEEQSQALIAAGVNPSAGATGSSSAARAAGSQVVQIAGEDALQLPDSFERAWRRVGTSLDRTGFTVEDRDRSQGIYYVRYVDPTAERAEPGFFGRIVGRKAKIPPLVKYRIVLAQQNGGTVVRLQTEAGQPAAAQEAKAILELLNEDLR